jgi:hypothetical protein
VQDSTADALKVLEALDKLREHLSAFPSSPPNFAIDMSSSDEDDIARRLPSLEKQHAKAMQAYADEAEGTSDI